MRLSDEEKKAGVVAASMGNHAQGLSYHSNKLGIPCTVVMPVTAPLMKIQKCRMFNAEVIVNVMSQSDHVKCVHFAREIPKPMIDN